jgi:hypothetical protein
VALPLQPAMLSTTATTGASRRFIEAGNNIPWRTRIGRDLYRTTADGTG